MGCYKPIGNVTVATPSFECKTVIFGIKQTQALDLTGKQSLSS